MSHFLIRRATDLDSAELARLAGQLGYPASEDTIRRRLQRLLASSNDVVFVAHEAQSVEGGSGGLAGWIHGVLSQFLESDYRVEIAGMVVDERFRRQGAGRDLVKRVEDWASGHGAGQCSVRCRTNRAEAHQFYESLGYSQAKTQIVFRKPLPSPCPASNEARKRAGPAARLVSLNEPAPLDMEIALKELGAGDMRFRGTGFGRGECDLQTTLQEWRDFGEGKNIPADIMPQSTFWLVNEDYKVVGIVRVRHRLNERSLQYGGHIGYYIRPAERGKGYGKKALQLALEKLRRAGTARALLTVHPDNTISKQIVLACGGVQDGQGQDPVSGAIVDRYWIDSKE